MSRDTPDPGTSRDAAKEHETRKGSEDLAYRRLRENNVHPEHARRIAREAADKTHRGLDRRYSSEGERATRDKTKRNQGR